MSGQGHPDQQNYGNPADFFNNGAQQGGSGHDFFEQQQNQQQQQQQQNWYQQQQPPGAMPANSLANNPPAMQANSHNPPAMPANSLANNPQAAAAAMFYNPADYTKGAVTQQALFNPNQQQQDDNNQQPEISQQFQADNYPNSATNQWENNTNQAPPNSQGWNYHPQQDPNYNHSDGNIDQQTPGQDYMPNSSGQQPYYWQHDPMQGHGDHPAQWNEVQDAVPGAWNNQNSVQTNMPQGDSGHKEATTEKSPAVEEEDDSGGGYIGMFAKDDDEPDFLESSKTESPEHTNQQQNVSPRTQSDSGVISPDRPPSEITHDQSHNSQHLASPPHQPGQDGTWPSHQVQSPPIDYNLGSQSGISHPGVEGYSVNTDFQAHGSVVDTGFEAHESVVDTSLQAHGSVVQQDFSHSSDNAVLQHFQQDAPEGQYFPMQYPQDTPNPQVPSPGGDPRSYDGGPPSEHDGSITSVTGSLHPSDSSASLTHSRSNSEVAGSLHPSESSASLTHSRTNSEVAGSLHPSDSSASLTTSRSNSLLEDAGGSTAQLPNIASSESYENLTEPRDQSGNISGPLSSSYSAEEDQLTMEATSAPIEAQNNILVSGQQNVQPISNAPIAPYLHGDIPPVDISRQNSALSDVSNLSVPSDTNIARTGSLLAESDQMTDISQANTSEPLITGSSIAPGASIALPPTSTQTLQQHQISGQDIAPMLQPSDQTSMNSLQQTDQSVELRPGEMAPAQNQINPQANLSNPVSLTSNVVVVPTSPVHSSNPLIQTNPLLSGTAHPSAFRTVRAQHNKTPTSAAVNPSPPLWSTEIPSLPSNILLAPASVTSSPSPSLATPKQPVKLDSHLAASIANVCVPPPPSEATSLLGQTSGSDTKTASQVLPNQTVPSLSSGQAVEQVTHHMAGLSVGQIQPVLVPPVMTAAQPAQQSVAAPPQQVGIAAPAPQVPVHGVQSVPSINQSMGQRQVTLTASLSAPALANQSGIVQPVHPVAVLPGGQPVIPGGQPVIHSGQPVIHGGQPVIPGGQPVHVGHPVIPATSSAQNPQQHQQPGYPANQQQVPPGQGQWYGGQGYGGQGHGGQGHGQYPNHNNPQQHYPYQPHDFRSQQEYDQYYRQYAKQHPYYNRERPYSRQGYGEHDRSYRDREPAYRERDAAHRDRDPAHRERDPAHRDRDPAHRDRDPTHRDRDPTRSYSRQGYGQERPGSRQGKGYEQYAGHDTSAYYSGYSRRDPKSYGEHEEYYRRHGQHGYDPRYEEWYRSRDYYRQQRAGNKNNKSYDQNTSGLDQSHNESRSNRTTDAVDGSTQERFAEDFHHTGGDTPEKYGANQSNISGTPGYGNPSDPYSNRGYGQYGEQQRSYDNGYGNTDRSYGYGDPSYVQQPPKPATPPPPERMTPCKFNRPHMVARFSSGGHLIKVMPNSPTEGQPAVVEIHSVESMLEHNDEYSELKAFPGPLVRNHTHKNDVVRFALQMGDNCRKSTDITDKESAALLWDLMVLLCRQNGTIVGTDISELLLKDHPMTSEHDSPPSILLSSQPNATAAEEDREGEEEQSQHQELAILPLPVKSLGPDIEKETHRFRELLLFGRRKEALESAIKGGLWGHALLMSCKMDHRTHLSVMTRFANSLPMNDPLQTLYQLMSNRQPAAVTSCSDEKWGDWRPHLAMILSNLVDNASLDVKSITSLGDSLASRGLLFASHFCYLMAQIGLGHYSNKVTKMVLLGASHSLPLKEFLRRPPIQQTEVYEYAQSLANKKYALPTFQVYKFIYATQLLDYGFVTQALHYCEVIANIIQYLPAYYSPELITQVSELSHRLKYHDHQYFDGREVTDPDWLKMLDYIKIQYEEGAIQPISASDTPMPWVESSSNLSQMGDSISSEGPSFEVNQPGMPGGLPQRMGTPHSEDYGMGGSTGSVKGQQDQGQEGYDGGQQGYDGGQQMHDQTQGFNLDQTGYYQPADGANAEYPAVQTPQQTSSGYDWNNQQYGDQQQQQQYGDQQQQQQYGDQQQQQPGGNYADFGVQPSDNTKPPNLDLGASVNSNFSEYSTTSGTTAESGQDTDLADSGASQAFDYYGMSTKTATQENGYAGGMGSSQFSSHPSPTKTMTPPDTPISRTRQRTTSEGSSQMTPTPQQHQPKQEKPKEKKKKDSKTSGKKGWFRGWFGGDKEMHLPDDKDKTIQWDEKKQKWVNMDGDAEEDDNPPPPPPKDHEMSGGGAPTAAPSAGPGGPPAGGPPPGVNRFSRKAAGGRGNYVDVFKGSTKSTSLPPPSQIFDTLPATNSMPTNFFIPQAGSDPAEDTNQPQVANPDSRSQTPASSRSRQNSGAQQTPTNTQPQFFNPNTYGNAGSGGFSDSTGYQDQTQQPAEQQEENLSDSSSMSSLSQEVSQLSQHMNNQQPDKQSGWQQEESAAPPPGPPAVTNPMMFNPTAFAQQSHPSQQPASRRGYGARRQYPR